LFLLYPLGAAVARRDAGGLLENPISRLTKPVRSLLNGKTPDLKFDLRLGGTPFLWIYFINRTRFVWFCMTVFHFFWLYL
jgi:hypothetical protein